MLNELFEPNCVEADNNDEHVEDVNSVVAKSEEPKEAAGKEKRNFFAIIETKENYSRARATISFGVNCARFDTTESLEILSPVVSVNGLPWMSKILFKAPWIGFFLHCEGKSEAPKWSCRAFVDLRVRCFRERGPDFTRGQFSHLYSAKQFDYGYISFIAHDDLMNPGNCYVKNNSVTFEVHFYADRPRGIYKKQTNGNFNLDTTTSSKSVN